MPRPILDERMTVRMPEVLLGHVLERAARRKCSANDVVLTCIENEFSRLDTYSLDYYGDLMPLVEAKKGDNVRH